MPIRAFACLVASLVLALSPGAAAQQGPLVARLSLGAGAMISHDQLGWLGLDGGGVGAAGTVSYAVLEPLFAELRIGGSYFLTKRGPNGAIADAGAGLRVSAPATAWLRLEAAAHVGAGWTGLLVRPCADVSLAAGLSAAREVTIGPEVSYGHVFWTDGPSYSTDAGFVMVSLFLAWRPEREPDRVRVVERTRVRRTVAREIVTVPLPLPPPPPDRVELDRLLDRALPVTHREEVLLIPPVLFDFDSSAIEASGEVALYAARDLIAEMPDAIVIEGHADGRGSDEYNVELSMARAAAVRDWLVGHGIDAARLTVEAYGERAPLADEVDDRARQLSRRVTFRAVRVSEEEPGE